MLFGSFSLSSHGVGIAVGDGKGVGGTGVLWTSFWTKSGRNDLKGVGVTAGVSEGIEVAGGVLEVVALGVTETDAVLVGVAKEVGEGEGVAVGGGVSV